MAAACNHTQSDREAATTSNAVAVAERVGACPGEGRAICSNNSQSPTTNRRLVESIPIDNKRTTIGLHRLAAV